MSAFVGWLDEQLRARSWSYSELARRAGLSSSGVSMVMTGQAKPGVEFCLRTSEALHEAPTKVFRLAGLLPPAPGVDETLEEIVFNYERMRPESREYLRVIARAFAEGG